MGAVTLDDIRDLEGGRLYPQDLLEGLSTALMGFCAAFLGRQDCVWVADWGITADCVDTDQERLAEMADIYPHGWTFHCDNMFDYGVRQWGMGATYDLVSLDPPTALFDQVASLAELWCSLATHAVVIGCGPRTEIKPPAIWQETERVHRSTFQGGVYWAILEPTKSP